MTTTTPELSNYNNVTYAKTLFTLDADVVSCVSGEYEDICKEYKTVNESIPADKPVKFYFDSDFKFTEDYEYFNINCANEVLRITKLHLTHFFKTTCEIEPRFAVAESHYQSRIVKGKQMWAYSFHIVVQNIMGLKSDIGVVATLLNKFILDDQIKVSAITGCDRYGDYMPPITEIFDLTVYTSGRQKFKSVHCSKPKENSQFNLVE